MPKPVSRVEPTPSPTPRADKWHHWDHCPYKWGWTSAILCQWCATVDGEPYEDDPEEGEEGEEGDEDV